jgi:UDP-glucose 4-epimerase
MKSKPVYIVTGCAGFIGSTLVDRLLAEGNIVIGIDNLSTGRKKFIDEALNNKLFTFYEFDLLDLNKLKECLRHGDIVLHLAANADVRGGTLHTRRDLEQNTIVTYNVLEAMRVNNVKKIVFSSTGSVYGEANKIPTSEDYSFPIQTSLYGASKVACEGLISAYCEGFGFQAWIFRFVSILGERYTHGHVFDFYHKLTIDSTHLDVLGDGKQRKSYLYVQDCVDGILLAIDKSQDKINIFNLGFNDFCEVNDSIDWICREMGVTPLIDYAGGKRGWIGDNPFIFLDTKRIQSLGWTPKVSIQEGVIKTVQYLRANEWVFETGVLS